MPPKVEHGIEARGEVVIAHDDQECAAAHGMSR